MTKETMNVHRALSELKIIDDRILGTIGESTFCAINKHSNTKIKGVEIEGFKAAIQGSWDKVSDLIKRRNAIKRAVVLSNARTKVSINGVEYTVAEAIDMKNHGIELQECLFNTLRGQYNKATFEIEHNNGQQLEDKADRYVAELYSNKDKADSEEVKKAKEFYIKQNSYDLIDPLKLADKIADLEEEINKFKADVDAVLSVSNATTEIEIEY